MKRAIRLKLGQGVVAAAAGWAGWQMGHPPPSSSVAEVTPVSTVSVSAPPLPPLPPGGWSRTPFPSISRPSFGDDEWARRVYDDPPAAVADVMSRPAGPDRNELIASLLRGWAARDPLAAAEWLAALAPEETPEMPFADVRPAFIHAPAEARTKGWLGFLAAKASPALLELAAEGHRPGGRGQPSGRGMANGLHDLTDSFAIWAAAQPVEAVAWARERSSPEARRWLLGAMVGALARNGAAAQAIKFYNAEPDLHETGAVRVLGEGWAQADPAAALAWAETLSDAELHDTVVSAALREIPDGQAPALLALTARVDDPEERHLLRENLFRRALWNQAAIREWIDTDPSLGDGERAQWREKLQAGGRQEFR